MCVFVGRFDCRGVRVLFVMCVCCVFLCVASVKLSSYICMCVFLVYGVSVVGCVCYVPCVVV